MGATDGVNEGTALEGMAVGMMLGAVEGTSLGLSEVVGVSEGALDGVTLG